MNTRRRVLIVQPSLRPPGGGQAVAAWMIEALKERHDVAVLSWAPVDFDALNRCFGTTIQRSDVTVYTVSSAIRQALDAIPLRLALLKGAVLARRAKHLQEGDEVLISADNEADLGRRGIQYIHYPRRLWPRPTSDIRWYHVAAVLDLYYALCERIMSFSFTRLTENLTLANSSWTADRMRRLYGNDVRIVHPPVGGRFRDVPWEARENGFLCIGRLAREKEIERVIKILAAVRHDVPEVHLHIVGGRERSFYSRRVARLARTHRDWIHLELDASREELLDLIAKHRYGIHGMREEHFGIAPAEMVAGGCIVFVPDGGGQVDIVGGDKRLLYATTADAVAKIVRVLKDPSEQAALRRQLDSQRHVFSAERFVQTIRDVVDGFESTSSSGAAA